MTSNLPNIGLVLGMVMLVVGTYGVRYTWRRLPALVPRSVLTVAAVGCAVAVLAFGQYRPSPTERYIGFPFLSAAFLKKQGVWRDYVGPLSVPALLANAYVGFSVPFVVAAAWLLARPRVLTAGVPCDLLERSSVGSVGETGTIPTTRASLASAETGHPTNG